MTFSHDSTGASGSKRTTAGSANRRSGTRTPEELRKAKAELAARFTELEAKAAGPRLSRAAHQPDGGKGAKQPKT